MKAPILMVHGAFCGAWAFERFRLPFEAAAHGVFALDLPGHAPDQAASSVAGVSMRDYAEAVCTTIDALPAPPVLIGHSLGGLVAQLAAARRRIAGLVLLAPSSPWGVPASSAAEFASALALYALGPYWSMAVEPSPATARQWMLDKVTRERRREIYPRLRPESGLALFETLNWWLDARMTTFVPAAQVRAPVLAVGGEADAIHPPSTVAATARRLGGQVEIVRGASHWLMDEDGWEDLARLCLDWIDGAAVPAAA